MKNKIEFEVVKVVTPSYPEPLYSVYLKVNGERKEPLLESDSYGLCNGLGYSLMYIMSHGYLEHVSCEMCEVADRIFKMKVRKYLEETEQRTVGEESSTS